MATILHLESSGPICSVALSQNGIYLDALMHEEANMHGQIITILIDRLLKNNCLNMSELNAVSVSSGPGSYTGLRIGSSTAKGLCYALQIPLIAISTLDILFHSLPDQQALILIDARRLDAYAAFYHKGEKIFEKNTTLNNSFFEELKKEYGPFPIYGNTGDKILALLQTSQLQYTDIALPQAKDQVRIAYEKWKNKDFESLDLFKPNYLKTWEEGQAKQFPK